MLNTDRLLSIEIQTALVVANTASFGRAARQLGVQQSTVSRRIRDLEDHIGVSLFERYAHGVRTTNAGAAFLDCAKQSQNTLALAAIEAQQAGRAGNGVLKLGFVWSFTVGAAKEIVTRFREQNRGVRVELTELGATALLDQVLWRRIDCAWIVRLHQLDPTLEVEPLWKEAAYLARPQDPGRIAGASQRYLRRTSDEWPILQRNIIDFIDDPRMEIHVHNCSRESLLSLIAAGDGITLLPESIAKAGYPGVSMIPVDPNAGQPQISAVWRRETDNPALRRFMALTRVWLRKNRPLPSSDDG